MRKELVPISSDDRAFFEAFYREHKRFLYYTAKKYTKSSAECEDVVQDTIIRLLSNVSALRDIGVPKVQKYVALTVKSAIIDRERKKRKSGPGTPKDEIEEALLQEVLALEAPLPDVESRLEVEKLKTELDLKEWVLLQGKYILGYTQDELGDLIGVAPNSVRMGLSRAREKARRVLNDSSNQGGKQNE